MNIENLKSPEAIYRPAPFWSWNDKLDKEELIRQIDEMCEKGWGGYFMHSRVGLVTEYLGEEWMEFVRLCAEQARKTGTSAWLYDEDLWPSGFASGKVAQLSEDFREKALVLLKEDQIGENDQVLQKTEENGELFYICKRTARLGQLRFNGGSYIDTMNPDAVDAFLEITHEQYKKAVGEYFGKEIPGIFTDEPCILMHGDYRVPALPWSSCLSEYFEDQCGYKIEEHLEQLFFDRGNYQKIRFDFFDSAVQLFMHSFSERYSNWCKENNLKMTGHYMAEDSLTYQTEWVGAVMPQYQYMDWPGIDKLGRVCDHIVTVKQVTSVADQLDKERAFCEIFGCIGQHASFMHRKWIGDWQAALGINFVNSHLSLYSMRGERKRDYPCNLFYQQPWWDNERIFSDYSARICYALSMGKRDLDILVIHPLGTVWSEYSPLHRKDGFWLEEGIYNAKFQSIARRLTEHKLDYHFGDELIMRDHASVKDGKLYIGSAGYSTVVVPPCSTLRSSTIALLEEFAKTAGAENLIMTEIYPERIDAELTEKPILEHSKKLKNVDELIEHLDQKYKDRVSVTDTYSNSPAWKVFCHERTSESGKVFFFANTDNKRSFYTKITLPVCEIPCIMDLTNGKVYKADGSLEDGRFVMHITFMPAGSLMLLTGDLIPDSDITPNVMGNGTLIGKLNGNRTLLENWTAKPLEENVLPINDASLYLNGRLICDEVPLQKIWHDHFYKASNGTPFKAEYKFEVEKLPSCEVFAAIETAENLDSVKINGTLVTPLKSKGELGSFNPSVSWKDINFTKVPLTGLLKEGTNIIELEGVKINNIVTPGMHEKVKDPAGHFPTEVETVYLVGNFKVTDINREEFFINGDADPDALPDLTANGYPFYSGKVSLKTSVEGIFGNKKTCIKLGDPNIACAELFVNGNPVGQKGFEPYIFDVSEYLQDGKNDIEVVITTTLFNVMGPNRTEGIEHHLHVGPHTFLDSNITDTYYLRKFGMKNAVLIEL